MTTYKDFIRSLTAYVSRSESAGSTLIKDDDDVLSVQQLYDTIDFPNGFSGLEEDGCYILTVAQSGYTPLGK